MHIICILFPFPCISMLTYNSVSNYEPHNFNSIKVTHIIVGFHVCIIFNAEINVKFTLRNQTYLNNSIVSINDIGEADNALLCVTNNPDCCKPPPQGEFYYPNNTAVGFSSTNSLYRNRGLQVVRLNRRNDVLSQTGSYKCEIPDSTGMNRSIYINITG